LLKTNAGYDTPKAYHRVVVLAHRLRLYDIMGHLFSHGSFDINKYISFIQDLEACQYPKLKPMSKSELSDMVTILFKSVPLTPTDKGRYLAVLCDAVEDTNKIYVLIDVINMGDHATKYGALLESGQ